MSVGAPVEEAAGIYVDRRSQLLGACGDHVDVVRPPEQQVYCVEGQVGAEAWGRVDCDKAAPVSTVEDVPGSQVAM